jgi:hypothetical protein
MPPKSPVGIIGMVEVEDERGGFPLSVDRVHRIQMPTRVTKKDLERIQRDFELLSEIVKNNPQEMAELLEAVTKNHILEAQRIADKLELTEEHISAKGGGLIWLAAVAVGLSIILFTCRLPEEAPPV